MSLVGHWEEAKFPAGINLVQTMAPGWRQIVSEVALDLITIPVVSALLWEGGSSSHRLHTDRLPCPGVRYQSHNWFLQLLATMERGEGAEDDYQNGFFHCQP